MMFFAVFIDNGKELFVRESNSVFLNQYHGNNIKLVSYA